MANFQSINLYFIWHVLYLQSKDHNVLMTVISGDAVEEMKSLSDDQIVEKCIECIKGLFPGQVS